MQSSRRARCEPAYEKVIGQHLIIKDRTSFIRGESECEEGVAEKDDVRDCDGGFDFGRDEEFSVRSRRLVSVLLRHQE